MLNRFYSEIKESTYVISNFINQDLTVKYKHSILGFFWSLLNPIAIMFIMSIVFSAVMKFSIKDFAIFLFAGLLPWNFIAQSVDTAGSSIVNNESFIKKIYLPKIVFPISSVCSTFINMILSMIALFIIMLFIGAKITSALLFLPISFIILFLFTLGLSLIITTLHVFFRDIKYLMNIIMNAWYYFTPVLYPIVMIPEHIRIYFYWNPIYYIIIMFRAPIYDNVIPDIRIITVAALTSLIMFIFGLFIFYSNEKYFVFRL